LSIDEGIKFLVSDKANHTLNIHDFTIPIKKGKGKVEISIMDSCGILPIIHHMEIIREGITQTLQQFKQASAIFHVIDSSCYVSENIIDKEIYDFGLQQNNYLILANKIDLERGKLTVPRIKNDFSKAIVLPISAKTGEGMSEVIKYVNKLI
jgi:tRNA U34 5-carboxymethylaminomethyl modifying GTPase MnmE/TrmE